MDQVYTVAHTANQWRHTRRARGFSRDDVMAAILKVWLHIRNPTSSFASLEEQSCQILSRSDLKRRSFRLFSRGRPNNNKKKHNKNKMSSDMGSVPDPIKTGHRRIVRIEPIRNVKLKVTFSRLLYSWLTDIMYTYSLVYRGGGVLHYTQKSFVGYTGSAD